MKEVQPSFCVEWYKSCTLGFKMREKKGENSSKWYIEEVVHYKLVYRCSMFVDVSAISTWHKVIRNGVSWFAKP